MAENFSLSSTILEYQKVHPVVVNYIKAIQISPDDEDMPHQFLQQVKEYLPEAPDLVTQERQIASDYKNLAMPLYILFQCFNDDWRRLLQFAQHNKLRLGTGALRRQQLEESWVGHDIVVDAQTLIIMAVCNCLPALQVADHVHISYSSVAALQYFYLSNNYGLMAIDTLMDWLNSEQATSSKLSKEMIDLLLILVRLYVEQITGRKSQTIDNRETEIKSPPLYSLHRNPLCPLSSVYKGAKKEGAAITVLTV